MTTHDAINEYREEMEAIGRRSVSWKSFAKEVAARWPTETVEEAASPVSVKRWIADCRRRENRPATIQNKLCFLRALCRLANESGHPAKFPTRLSAAIKVDNKRTRTLEKPEARRLQDALHSDDWDICLLASKTGLRSQELFGLRTDDCNFRTGMMLIRITKTGVSREIPMVGVVRDLCAKAAKGRREFVVNPRGFKEWKNRHYMATAWKHRVFRVALARADITDFRWHDWRHVATTNMIEAGADPVAVTTIMGWESPKYLMRYANLQRKSLAKAMALA